MKLVLTFSSHESPVLTSVAFQREGHEPRLLLRGKQVSTRYADGTFQWSRAVRALTLLLVGSVVFQDEDVPYVLSGEKGSAAASLDYALSKPTQWILDMFGCMENEKPYALRLLGRRNSERKLSGPIEVFLQQPNNAQHIHLTDNSQKLLSYEECYSLFQSLGGTRISETQVEAVPEESQVKTDIQLLFSNEVSSALSDVSILEPLGISRCCKRIQAFDWCSPAFVETLDFQLQSAMPASNFRYKLLEDSDVQAIQPCTIAVLPLAIAPLILVRALQKRGAPIQLQWQFSGTADMLVEPLSHCTAYCCVLSIGAVAQAVNHKLDYLPSMLLPRTSFSLLDPSPQREHIYCASGKQGYPYQLYQALCAEGEIKSDVSCSHCTLAEAAIILKKAAGSVIVGFPYSSLLKSLPGIRESTCVSDQRKPGENVLCTSAEYDAAPLIGALRGVWYELLDDQDLCEELTRDLLQDATYYKYIKRLGGLHALAVL